ncbi:carboxypeptidase-like regulatory domain-containing protein [Gloeobacter violaceus]|uniref:Gll1128 protein n=1 Tax=Gloeobacter violaceus (strain ATCC 29082 / PCC 7421) TaxID=251221 RepID=Q7NLJ5_GLOVI|nr:carboxypeptidase-like regulatory domain-containing protein [Gloeobacter violaceus]BAC89069.1 gll1128 [Gloeobacter violaceus PCC 7421]
MKQPPKHRPERKRPMPMRRFEEAAETLDEEEKKTRKPLKDDPLADAEVPRYLRRDTQNTGSLVRLSLVATGFLTVAIVGVAFLTRPEPNPEVPAGTKPDRGLVVLASPRGYTATLYPPGAVGAKKLVSLQDGQSGDEKDGFVWFKDLPSRAVPAGNYVLDIATPGYKNRRLPVTVQAGKPARVGYNTNTALEKAGG